MELIKAHVTNFRSVEDSEEFDAGQVVCLVGKNEAGKSALLTALAALNPHPSTPAIFDKERDYPRRHLASYAERHPDEDAITIVTEWVFADDEKAELDMLLGAGALGPTIKIQRRYGGDIEYAHRINFDIVLPHLYKQFDLADEEITVLGSPNTTDKLIDILKNLQTPSESHKKLLDFLGKEGSATQQATKFIKARLPKFMYVSSYDRMDGTVQFEQIGQLKNQNALDSDENRGKKLFLEFLQYAGISLDELLKQNNQRNKSNQKTRLTRHQSSQLQLWRL